MPQFCFTCMDAPKGLVLRQQKLAAHMVFAQRIGDRLRIAGPLFDPENGAMIGSLAIIEADSVEEARALMAQDPFAQAGVFAEITVHGFQAMIGALVQSTATPAS